MKLLGAYTILLLVEIISASIKGEKDDIMFIYIDKYVPETNVIYESNHDIVSILVPMNSLNLDDEISSSYEEFSSYEGLPITFFFIEADVDADGKLTYQGLYVFKNGKAKKILNNGREATAPYGGNSMQVLFAAQDGLYEYKSDIKEAVKYGTVTDSIIGIAKTNSTDIIYILTEDHELYKITDAGNTKTKVDEVVDAQEIILDRSDNLYFYGQDKRPYVLSNAGLKSIDGLPSNPTKVKFIRPFYSIPNIILFNVDNTLYTIYANGTSELCDFKINSEYVPTAYAMDFSIIQYFGFKQKIYEVVYPFSV